MMKSGKWKTYAFWIVLSEAAGALSGWLSREGTAVFSETAVQPPLSPPAILFPIVWTVLYLLMGIGSARVSLSAPSPERSKGLNLFIVQLVALMILSFRKIDPIAAWLQIPYLLWLTFAAYLNAGVWYLNQ